jgi:thiamine-phosphate pyrophosphorylase
MPDISAQRFAAAIIKARVDGMAVVPAICTAPDPERAARELAQAVRAAR